MGRYSGLTPYPPIPLQYLHTIYSISCALNVKAYSHQIRNLRLSHVDITACVSCRMKARQWIQLSLRPRDCDIEKLANTILTFRRVASWRKGAAQPGTIIYERDGSQLKSSALAAVQPQSERFLQATLSHISASSIQNTIKANYCL